MPLLIVIVLLAAVMVGTRAAMGAQAYRRRRDAPARERAFIAANTPDGLMETPADAGPDHAHHHAHHHAHWHSSGGGASASWDAGSHHHVHGHSSGDGASGSWDAGSHHPAHDAGPPGDAGSFDAGGHHHH